MINLNYYPCVEISEYDAIANSKRGITRTLLQSIRARVDIEYNSYLNSFNTISTKGPNTFNQNESAALRHCYGVKTSARNLLIVNIINSQVVELKSLCGYCLLEPRKTIDHYIPQEEYPVFATMVKNLIPSCHTCNAIKNDIWRNNGSRVFIHLLIDLLPQAQFLFGRLNVGGNAVPNIRYSLTRGSVPLQQFAIIQEHFNRLGLVDRYSNDGTTALISEIKIDVQTNRLTHGNITAQTIQNLLTNKSIAYRQRLGNNYWKAVALDLLANSHPFINSL